MYRRRILCILYGAVDLLSFPYKGLYAGDGGGGEYVMILRSLPFQGPKKSRFQGPPLPMALVMDIAHIKIITSRAI
jgi:hypothetical protein